MTSESYKRMLEHIPPWWKLRSGRWNEFAKLSGKLRNSGKHRGIQENKQRRGSDLETLCFSSTFLVTTVFEYLIVVCEIDIKITGIGSPKKGNESPTHYLFVSYAKLLMTGRRSRAIRRAKLIWCLSTRQAQDSCVLSVFFHMQPKTNLIYPFLSLLFQHHTWRIYLT